MGNCNFLLEGLPMMHYANPTMIYVSMSHVAVQDPTGVAILATFALGIILLYPYLLPPDS